MGLGRVATIISKIVVLIFLMALLTLLCFLPLWLLGQLKWPYAQESLLILLAVSGAAFAWWLFYSLPSRIPKERTHNRPVHPADRINTKFKEELFWTLQTPSHLSNLEFSEYVELFDPWCGGDLFRFMDLHLISDPRPVARIQHAAAQFALGSIDSAKTILEQALAEENAPPAFAVAKAELLTLTGDFNGAADIYENLSRLSLSPEARLVLRSRELRARARAGHFQTVRLKCAAFIQNSERDASIYMLDSLASLPLMHEFQEFVDEALDYNQQAISILPNLPGLKVTRAALLYEKRERQEAKRLLQECLWEITEDYDHAVCHFYLALIERKRGHLPEAKKLAERVRSFSKDKWLMLRLRREFAL